MHLTSYLFIALSKILPHSKTKNAKKLSLFGENDSRRLSNFLQTHILWNFDHISRIYNQINYRNIWFAKVTIILIMTAQVLFFNVFSEKDPHLNVIEDELFTRYSLLTTFYSLLLTRYSLLLSCYFLFVTRYFPFVTRHYLIVTL